MSEDNGTPPIKTEVSVYLRGERIAEYVTKHQQRRARRNPTRRLGPVCNLDTLAALATPGPWSVERAEFDPEKPNDETAVYYIISGKGEVTKYADDRDYHFPEGGMSKEDAEFVVALANDYWSATSESGA